MKSRKNNSTETGPPSPSSPSLKTVTTTNSNSNNSTPTKPLSNLPCIPPLSSSPYDTQLAEEIEEAKRRALLLATTDSPPSPPPPPSSSSSSSSSTSHPLLQESTTTTASSSSAVMCPSSASTSTNSITEEENNNSNGNGNDAHNNGAHGDEGDDEDDGDNENDNAEDVDDKGRSLLRDTDFLQTEDDDGNVEYKWKLVGLSQERFDHLVTQMKYRMTEGQGEAIYELGIDNDGQPRGLTVLEFDETMENLTKMARELEADVSMICEKTITKKELPGVTLKTAEVLVRKYGDGEYLDLRVCVSGNVDSGKSTMIGVLTRGGLDNGRGLARAAVFTHKHELDTGRTSAISQQILGFDSKGNAVNYAWSNNGTTPSWEDIVSNSAKLCTFIDLAGHEKYLKTTVFGMTGSLPDYSCVLIGSNMGITRMTKEHIGLSLALKIPMFFVVTKIDMCPQNIMQETLASIHKILKLPGVRKMPYMVRTNEDVVSCARNIPSDHITPIFLISSVTGEGLDLLRQFLNLLPIRRDWEAQQSKPAEVNIEQTFHVAGVGTVVSGIVTQGVIHTNDTLLLGPDSNGKFKPVTIKSVHCKRVATRRAVAGQQATFALKKEKRSNIRKGMRLIDPKCPHAAVWEFEADVFILYHSTTVKVNYQPVCHIMCVRQSARLVWMDRESLRTGDKARVRFRFMFHPEYIKEGERMVFREGRTKGLGIVVKPLTTTTTTTTTTTQ